jgi:glycosyltransferase involved in cell wall biosynthesis
MWKQFDENNFLDYETTISFSNNEYLSELNGFRCHRFLKGTDFKGKRIVMNSLNSVLNYSKFIDKKFDVFHPTYYSPYFKNLIGSKPYVITFYDAIHVLLKERFEILQDRRLLENQRTVLSNASAILAISENTKKDLIELFNIDESKIFVTYLSCNSFDLETATQLNLNLPDKYILYVGNRDVYKNFLFFVESIRELLIKNDIELICAGGGKFSVAESNLFDKYQIGNRIKYFSVNNNILAKLYSNALAFAFPSLYEGFGIPILEAMYCNCPVAASNVSSLPEIGGDAVDYFDPEDMGSICQSIERIISNSSYRNKLINQGRSQVAKFSWNSTALSTIDVYKKLI